MACLAAFLLTLGGCTYRYAEPTPTDSVAYVLNTVVSPGQAPHPLLVNGEFVSRLQPGEYTWFRLEPGLYDISVSGVRAQGETLSSEGVRFRPGQSRFLIYDEESREPYLIEYSERHARRWLRGKRYVPNTFGR